MTTAHKNLSYKALSELDRIDPKNSEYWGDLVFDDEEGDDNDYSVEEESQDYLIHDDER